MSDRARIARSLDEPFVDHARTAGRAIQSALFDARQLCENGCGRELGAIRWEVIRETVGRIYTADGPLGGEFVLDEPLIVCPGCAHNFPRKRQLPCSD